MNRRQKQFEFAIQGFSKPGDTFGGSLLKGNPKAKRPLDSKLPVLLTLRAERSVLRLPKTYKIVQEIIASQVRKHGLTIYSQANVGNHLHLLVKIPHVRAWRAFIRELTGRIAQAVAVVLTGDALGRLGNSNGLSTDRRVVRFWRFRPHTRIVRGWRKAFRIAKDYIHLNYLESEGFISRQETKTLKDLRLIWSDA